MTFGSPGAWGCRRRGSQPSEHLVFNDTRQYDGANSSVNWSRRSARYFDPVDLLLLGVDLHLNGVVVNPALPALAEADRQAITVEFLRVVRIHQMVKLAPGMQLLDFCLQRFSRSCRLAIMCFVSRRVANDVGSGLLFSSGWLHGPFGEAPFAMLDVVLVFELADIPGCVDFVVGELVIVEWRKEQALQPAKE